MERTIYLCDRCGALMEAESKKEVFGGYEVISATRGDHVVLLHYNGTTFGGQKCLGAVLTSPPPGKKPECSEYKAAQSWQLCDNCRDLLADFMSGKAIDGWGKCI